MLACCEGVCTGVGAMVWVGVGRGVADRVTVGVELGVADDGNAGTLPRIGRAEAAGVVCGRKATRPATTTITTTTAAMTAASLLLMSPRRSRGLSSRTISLS